jgi:hypothetical protein
MKTRLTGSFPRTSLSVARVFWEKRDAQWLSLDRPRSYPARAASNHPTSVLCPPSTSLSSTLQSAPRKPLIFLFFVFFGRSYTSPKWVPFRKSTPMSPSRPSPSSSSLVSPRNTPPPLSPMKTGVNCPAAESMANIFAAGTSIYSIFP